jgi:hypothetical protein
MTLLKDQIEALVDAIMGYNFPCVCYDFLKNCPAPKPNMRSVEEFIRNDLIGGNPASVKNGLSNIIYWGFARVGFRDSRVETFRNQVTQAQLYDAARYFKDPRGVDLIEIKKLRLPQFSGMSFISKIRMFLDPKNFAILDKQILKMNETPFHTLLKEIAIGKNETQIRISKRNVRVYTNWCKKCSEISTVYFKGKYRVVDLERGFFTLIQSGKVDFAAEILSKA